MIALVCEKRSYEQKNAAGDYTGVMIYQIGISRIYPDPDTGEINFHLNTNWNREKRCLCFNYESVSKETFDALICGNIYSFHVEPHPMYPRTVIISGLNDEVDAKKDISRNRLPDSFGVLYN